MCSEDAEKYAHWQRKTTRNAIIIPRNLVELHIISVVLSE
jgi:hypothetical protein